MSRGQLRVYLGLAPGVGKTYKMLDEGWRRRERGADVVAGYVETHQRPHTVSQVRDLEIVARKRVEYRGTTLEEMDLEAILERRPELVLVDELAHTNAPGCSHEKRWEDVEALLDAGIDVITTVNIQHLESVNDVVEKITGVVQRETVPDFVVRRAEQIELVDITPEALRRRMAHGNIYPADKIDASLSNFFRAGNLSALRELSLLWLADRVEDSLQDYLDSHDIHEAWETRERLIVAVTGSASDEVLLRRAARIASRNHAEIVAVHVIDSNAMRERASDTTLARELVVEFEGTFQEIIDEDVASALVAFARAERGTQIVLGSSRHGRSFQLPGGVVEKVLRQVRDLDVHIIAVQAESATSSPRRRRRPVFSWSRTLVALALTAVVMPMVTLALTQIRSGVSLSTVFLVYLVTVLALAAWSGVAIGAVAALAASALENYYFVLPLHTFDVARPDDVVSIVAFFVFAIGASLAMTEFTRRSSDAVRARAESELLSEAVATVTASRDDLRPLLDTLRAVFAVEGAALVRVDDDGDHVEVASGVPPERSDAVVEFRVDDEFVLWLTRPELDNQDRQLITALAARLAAALQVQNLMREAKEMKERVETDALRIGLLRSIAHDVRPSLATMEHDVASLLRSPSNQSEGTRASLTSLSRELNTLTRVVTNLLDSGRLESKMIAPRNWRVSVAELVRTALGSLDAKGHVLDLDVAVDLPMVTTDPDLLERVITNVVSNALRFSPADQPVRLTAGMTATGIELLVIDHGPGTRDPRRRIRVANEQREEEGPRVAEDDLALSVAAGFIKLLGGELRFDDTPGGGLTVAICLGERDPLVPLDAPDPEARRP
jgi:two-component system sensor histidine kinase KdpD